jgi:hypothetical protein
MLNVMISTLSHAIFFEHVQKQSETPAHMCEPLRTANEYNLCQTCHERMTTYTNVHPNSPERRAHVRSIRNSVTGRMTFHQHLTGRSMLGIRCAFVGHSLRMLSIRWMDDARALSFVIWTLVIRSTIVPHSLGIRLIRQQFAVKKQILAANLSVSALFQISRKKSVR